MLNSAGLANAQNSERNWQTRELPGQGCPPMKGSRTRSLLPESAFQRFWSGSPRREGVPGNLGESQNEGQEDEAKRKGIPSWDLLLRKREQLNIGGSP